VHSLDEDDISPEQFNDLVQSLSSRSITYSKLQDFYQRGALLAVFERLLAYAENIEMNDLAPLLTALFDVSDECLPEWESPQRSLTDRLLLFLSSSILQRVGGRTERLRLFSSAVEKSNGLYLPVAKVALEEPDSKRQAVGGLREEELRPLQQICVMKIDTWAREGKLIDHPALGYILLRWQEWLPTNDCRDWVATQIVSKKGALAISTSLENRHYGSDGITLSMRIDLLEQIVDLQQLNEALGALHYDTLTSKEKEAVNRFHLAMQLRSEGASGMD
jgi:hypothetical protein